MNLPILNISYKWNHTYMAFCIWLLLFSIMLSRLYPCCSLYQYFISFYCQINSTVCIFHILFIYSSVDEHLGCFHFSLWVKLLWTFMYKFLYGHMFSILLGIYLGVELLYHMVTLCLTFWGTAQLFSKATISFCFPSAMYESCNFSTSSPTLIFCVFCFVLFCFWF